MLLIHVPKLTNRLGYTLNILFHHVLHTEFSITTDEEYFLASGGARLCYGPRRLGDTLHIKSSKLLFQTSIDEQNPNPFERDGQWMLFPVYGSDQDLPFDPLAATFYMVSRYEEYLPHREDEHGRFATAGHLAVEAGFNDEPVVDQWACMLRTLLMERYPDLAIPERSYRFVQTVDIDAAWCYKHKGFFRTVVGSLRDLIVRHDPAEVGHRFRVLLGREKDPFDTFDYILDQHRQRPGDKLIFFALVADYDQYDKPANYQNPHTRDLLQHLDDYASMGVHPGYGALEEPSKVDIDTRRLENILHRPISKSRYHFLRLHMPKSYNILIHAGLKDDYTMGYADATGFRAGISSPYPFYDLERDKETELTIHPFCVMDTTLQKYLKMTPEEGIERYRTLIDKLRRVGGTFCCIIHNQNLCERFGWQGWRQTYEAMLDIAKS
jgi:hypothetical protein